MTEPGKTLLCEGQMSGLVATLKQYCADFSDMNKITVDSLSTGLEEVRLDSETEFDLFRVAQEALTNVKNHARARKVTIKLQASQPHIVLSVEYNGRGCGIDYDIRNERQTNLQNLPVFTGRETAAEKRWLVESLHLDIPFPRLGDGDVKPRSPRMERRLGEDADPSDG